MKERVTSAVKKVRSYRRRLVATAVAALAAAAVTMTGVSTATGTSPAPATAHPVSAPVADEAPGYVVEDYNYPGADKILADDPLHTLNLKRGDGHILLATCTTGPEQNKLIDVAARNRADVCFRVIGSRGFLSLELPQVFAVSTHDDAAQVKLTVSGGTDTQTVDIPANTFKGVGESTDPDRRDWSLMEIRVGS